MNKKLLIPTIALTVLGFVGYGTSKVLADDTSTHPLAARIAEKFGLNEDEVSGFMSEIREERQTQMQANREENRQERLDELVANGTITEEQKALIEAKQQEMQAEREANREAHQQEMQAWADENGIDLSAIGGMGFGMGGHGGPGGPGGPKGPVSE